VGQKTLVQGWLNKISSTPWWGFIRDYTNTSASSGIGATALGMTFTQATDDLEVEGTTFNCTGNTADGAQNAIAAAISGATLANDPTGLYLVLPSWTDITTTGGCAGAHSSTTSVTPTGLNYLFATRPTAAAYGTTSPNSDYLFDNEMEVVSHEIGEALTNGTHLSGSGCGATEIADICAGCVSNKDWVGVKAFIGTNSAPASIRIPTVGDFWISAIYSTEQGGHCVNGQTPASLSSLSPCLTGDNCSWSGICTDAHCAIPTCSDGVQNGGESDIDCGSACGMNDSVVPETGNCASGKKCVTQWDCASLVCQGNGTCQ
jgi:hypothetical protein